jgi:gas vesicle protein
MSDREPSSDSTLALLAGIGLGALVGAMAALLLAPQSGAETRTQIRETADDVLSKLRDSVDDLRTKVDEMVASTKQAMGRRGEASGELGATGETA